MAKAKFPVFATILLIIGVVWAINEIGFYSINLPWLPIILIVVAIGMIFNRLR